jgi:hypothetical protein
MEKYVSNLVDLFNIGVLIKLTTKQRDQWQKVESKKMITGLATRSFETIVRVSRIQHLLASH